MKIYGLLLMKNEADVIKDVVQDALKWADKIFIADNGSDDGTWEIIQELASDRIILWGQTFANFQEGLRTIIWETIKKESNNGDWWCFMDSDEFYYDNPREFLKKVPSRFGVVAINTIQFEPLKSQEKQFEEIIGFDKKILTSYFQSDWTESRFFKVTNKLKYRDLSLRFPYGCRATYTERIKVLHYPLRSAKQVQRRLNTRRNAIEKGFKGWKHASQEKWQEKLRDNNDQVMLSVSRSGLQWKEESSNFKPYSFDFIFRRSLKSILYYIGLL